MKQDRQVEVLNKALRLIQANTTEMGGQTFTVPVDVYLSQSRLEEERDHLFRRLPLVVGFSSQVAKPGDFFTADLIGVPIIVLRSQDGKLNAFLNVCRHRGAKVVEAASGSDKKILVCPFHGWSYDDHGNLRSATCPTGFPDLDKSNLGLVPLAVAERLGLVFVLHKPNMTFDIDDYLSPLFSDLESFGLDDFVVMNPSTRLRKLNWKLQMDTSHENYHFSYLHSNTAGSAYFNNISMFDCAKPHARIFLPQRSILKLMKINCESWRIQDHCAVFYSIFPNTGLVFFGGYAHVLSTFPVDNDTSILQGGMLVPGGPVSEEHALLRKFHYDSYWSTMEEDISVGESMQAALRSGANSHFLFGRHEHVAGAFHETVEEILSGTWTPVLKGKEAAIEETESAEEARSTLSA